MTKHQLWIDRVSTPANTGMDQWTFHRMYKQGLSAPHYPVPAPVLDVEWVFEPYEWAGNGIFIRDHELWVKECWYADGYEG